MRNKLYYYRNKEEFDQFYEENNKNIECYDSIDSGSNLIYDTNKIIDITDLITYLMQERSHVYHIRLRLQQLDNSTKLIIAEQYKNNALNIFPLIFDEAIPIYNIDETKRILEKNVRHKIYYYDYEQFNAIEKECEKQNIILSNFASINMIKNYENRTIIDITSALQSMKGAEHIIYLLEQYFSTINNNTIIIVDVNELDNVKKYLRLTFSEYLSISQLFENILSANLPSKELKPVKRIIDLNKSEKESLFLSIDNNLIGHSKFKANLKNRLEDFLLMNKIGKRKVFSMFIMGNPGLGKTEIGRIISKSINSQAKIIKINFGNYSSQDALNSLIGSPAGYIGCDGGELSKKIKNNPVGVIICDEFEKADSEIKNFFLELLEDGKFTDSMSREYDLNGYIILFTSNIKNDIEFDKKMSPEFKSRLNIICEFIPLNIKEKEQYINHLIYEFKNNLEENKIKHKPIPEKLDIKCSDTDDLREIKDRIYNKLMKYID